MWPCDLCLQLRLQMQLWLRILVIHDVRQHNLRRMQRRLRHPLYHPLQQTRIWQNSISVFSLKVYLWAPALPFSSCLKNRVSLCHVAQKAQSAKRFPTLFLFGATADDQLHNKGFIFGSFQEFQKKVKWQDIPFSEISQRSRYLIPSNSVNKHDSM